MENNLIASLLLIFLFGFSNCSITLNTKERSLASICLWTISILQDNASVENELKLTYGSFSKFKILFKHNQEDPGLINHITGKLRLNVNTLRISANDLSISFDTAKSVSIIEYIGKDFPSIIPPPPEESITILFTFLIESLQLDTIISNEFKAFISTSVTPYHIQIILQEELVTVKKALLYTIKPSNIFLNMRKNDIKFIPHKNTSKYSVIEQFYFSNFPVKLPKYAYGIKELDWVVYPQVFTPKVVNYPQYFTIDKQVEFSLSEQTINAVNQEVKNSLKDIIINGNGSNDVLIENITISIFPVVLSCALYDMTLPITDDDIRNKQQGSYKLDQLQFYQQKITKALPGNQKLMISFKNLSRYSVFKLKCLIEVDKEIVPNPQNFQGVSFTIGHSSDADLQKNIIIGQSAFIETNCCTWEFINETIDKTKFISSALAFINKKAKYQAAIATDITEGCFDYKARDTLEPNTASICLVPLITCKSLHLYDYYHSFKENIDMLSTTVQIGINLNLNQVSFNLKNIIHESDYYPYNTKSIKLMKLIKTEDSVNIQITTNALPAECTAKLLDQKTPNQIFEDDFYTTNPNPNLQANVYQGKISTLIIPFSAPIQKDQLYIIYLNCRNLPQKDHYHYFNFFPLTTLYLSDTIYPLPDKEYYEDCHDYGLVMKPYCKAKTKSTYTTLFNPFLISTDPKNQHEYDKFQLLSIQERMQYTIDKSKLIDMEDFSEKDLIYLSMLCGYLSMIDCSEFPSYTRCRQDKIEINSRIHSKIDKKYKTVYTDILPWTDQTVKEAFLIKYTKVLYQHSINVESFSPIQAIQFMDWIYNYLNDTNKILQLFARNKRGSILTVFTAILNNFFDLVHFIEIDNGFSKDSKADVNTRLFPNSYVKRLKVHLEEILIALKNHNTFSNKYANFDYNFYMMSSTSTHLEKEVIELGDFMTMIEVPLKNLEEKKVNFIMGIVYYSFPLLSYNNTLTYYSPVTVKGYDSMNNYVEIKDLTLEWGAGFYYGENDFGGWKYCGYYDEINEIISSKGMRTIIYGLTNYNCFSDHFGDILLTSYDIYKPMPKPEPDPDPEPPKKTNWVLIVIISISAVVIIVIVIITIIACIKHAKKSSSSLNEILDENEINFSLAEHA